MIILNRDGTLTADDASESATQRIKERIEVPEDLVMQQPDLIDRILAFAFDILGLQTIDVRIRPASLGRHPEAMCNVPCR